MPVVVVCVWAFVCVFSCRPTWTQPSVSSRLSRSSTWLSNISLLSWRRSRRGEWWAPCSAGSQVTQPIETCTASVFLSKYIFGSCRKSVQRLESRNQTTYSSRESLFGCRCGAVNSWISLWEICSCFSFSVSCWEAEIKPKYFCEMRGPEIFPAVLWAFLLCVFPLPWLQGEGKTCPWQIIPASNLSEKISWTMLALFSKAF